jgi:hypothetical protein
MLPTKLYHMRHVFLLLLFACIGNFAQAQFLDKLKKTLKGGGTPTTEEVAAGLKEALTNGASKGSDLVSKTDGYFKNPEIKIPFPPEVKQVETKLRQLGMGAQVDKFVLALNRGAEEAAKESKPIFVSAIKQMTIQDAWNILKGEDNAATQYLDRTTSPQLTTKFKPVIQQALQKVSATKYYADLVNAYNKLPMVTKVNPNLDDYATEKAIDGLFVMVAKEEKLIRQDPAARTTDLLKKVFGAQK